MLLQRDYFELFNLEKTFKINISKLKPSYLALLKQFHPDKFSNLSMQEKQLSVQISSYINDAYKTIKDKIHRAEYLIEILHPESLSKAKPLQDPEFFGLQIQLREELELVSNILQKEKLYNKITAIDHELSEEFNNSFQSNIEASNILLQKMKFIDKLKHQVSDLEF